MTRTTGSIVILIASCALLLLMTKIFFLDIMVVRGRSMEPSLEEGTSIVINKLAFGLREPLGDGYLCRWREAARGDVIVFKNPLDGSLTLKRCLAVGNDRLEVRDGRLLVNGASVPLKHFQEDWLASRTTVPSGFIFAIGDNSQASSDSRTFGFIPAERVLGAMLFAPAPPKADL